MTKTVIRVFSAAALWSLIATSAFAIPVPELDPGSAPTVLALIAAGLLVLNGRRKG